MAMSKFEGWLRLPSPRELGMSKHNALGMRCLTPFQEGPFWEDWHAHVRKHYPVRYFFRETLATQIRRRVHGIERQWYRLKCHVLPSHQWHLLDLRGVDPLSEYDHGYLEPDYIFFLSGWAALRMWVEKEDIQDPSQFWTGDDANDPVRIAEKAQYDEAMALYHYWMVERLEEAKEEDLLSEQYRVARKRAIEANDREEGEETRLRWAAYRLSKEKRADEMWLRLAAIRTRLWT